MKLKCITIKKRLLLFISAAIILLCSVIGACFVIQVSSPKPEYTIVIDAGHGGVDVKLGQ